MKTCLRLPELVDRDITLRPSDDREYLLELSKRYKLNKLNDSELTRSLEYVKHLWLGERLGTLAGVIYLCFIPNFNWWTLDAYKDDRLLKSLDNKGDFSYRAGKLIIDWFFENKIDSTLYTVHEEANRGATIVCKRLGFKEVGLFDSFLILKLER